MTETPSPLTALFSSLACAEIEENLKSLANGKNAIKMRAYMRDQFEFLGIATPLRRQATNRLIRCNACTTPERIMAIAGQLWDLPSREFQYVAIDLLASRHRDLDLPHVDAMVQLVQQKSWWDTVDGLSLVVGKVLKRLLANDDCVHECMDWAVVHDNLWVRRVAMIHQLGWREKTDTARLKQYASKLAADPDFFIRKAIGWAFRDYAKHNAIWVRDTVTVLSDRLSPLSIREAMKHLQ